MIAGHLEVTNLVATNLGDRVLCGYAPHDLIPHAADWWPRCSGCGGSAAAVCEDARRSSGDAYNELCRIFACDWCGGLGLYWEPIR